MPRMKFKTKVLCSGPSLLSYAKGFKPGGAPFEFWKKKLQHHMHQMNVSIRADFSAAVEQQEIAANPTVRNKKLPPSHVLPVEILPPATMRFQWGVEDSRMMGDIASKRYISPAKIRLLDQGHKAPSPESIEALEAWKSENKGVAKELWSPKPGVEHALDSYMGMAAGTFEADLRGRGVARVRAYGLSKEKGMSEADIRRRFVEEMRAKGYPAPGVGGERQETSSVAMGVIAAYAKAWAQGTAPADMSRLKETSPELYDRFWSSVYRRKKRGKGWTAVPGAKWYPTLFLSRNVERFMGVKSICQGFEEAWMKLPRTAGGARW